MAIVFPKVICSSISPLYKHYFSKVGFTNICFPSSWGYEKRTNGTIPMKVLWNWKIHPAKSNERERMASLQAAFVSKWFLQNQIRYLLLLLFFLLLRSQLPLIKHSLCYPTVFLLFIHKLIRWPTLLRKIGCKSFLQSISCLLFTGHDGYNLYSQKLAVCLAIFLIRKIKLFLFICFGQMLGRPFIA